MDDKKDLQGKTLDDLMGFERGYEPLTVSECLQSKKGGMWYLHGYCLCARFYKCRYQGSIEREEDVFLRKERVTCIKRLSYEV